MKEKNERMDVLFKYLELLIEAEGNNHRVSREISEAIQALRYELGLDQTIKWDVGKGIYISNEKGTFSVDDKGNVNISSKTINSKVTAS